MKSKTKRIVTTICVACLMLIDLKAANDSWYIWIITNNMVGVLFAVIMFTAYPLKEYLKPFYITWDVIGILGVIGGYLFWRTHQIGHIMGFWSTVPLNIWFLGTVFFKYIEKIFISKELKIRFARWEYVFIACMLLMLISKSDYVWPFYFLVIFLMLWHMPYSGEDKRQLFMGVMDGLILGFIILQGKAFMYKSYGLVRYTGAYWNSNRNGAFYLLIYTVFLTRTLINKKQNKKTCLTVILSSVMAAFIMYTGSRTSLAGMIIITGIYYLIGERKIANEKFGRIVKQFAIFVVAFLVSIPLLYFPICYLPLIRTAIRTEIKNIVKGTDIPVTISNESSVQLNEALDNMIFRFLKSDVKDESVTDDHEDESDADISELTEDIAEIEDSPYIFDIEQYGYNEKYCVIEYYYRDYPERGKRVVYVPRSLYGGVTSLNIRINMYAVLIDNMNVLGHDSSEVFMVLYSNAPGTSDNWINNEQNFLIHYLYNYGVPVGILFCLMILIELIYLIRSTFKGDVRSFAFAMFVLVYICIGTMEVVWVPGQIVLILLFIAPLFFESRELAN